MLSVLDDLLDAVHAGRQQRHSQAHCIEDGDRQPLEGKREVADDIAHRHQLDGVATGAEEPHRVAQAELGAQALELPSVRPVAGHQQDSARVAEPDGGKRAQERRVILGVREPGDRHTAPAPSRCRGARHALRATSNPAGRSSGAIGAFQDHLEPLRGHSELLHMREPDRLADGDQAVGEQARRPHCEQAPRQGVGVAVGDDVVQAGDDRPAGQLPGYAAEHVGHCKMGVDDVDLSLPDDPDKTSERSKVPHRAAVQRDHLTGAFLEPSHERGITAGLDARDVRLEALLGSEPGRAENERLGAAESEMVDNLKDSQRRSPAALAAAQDYQR